MNPLVFVALVTACRQVLLREIACVEERSNSVEDQRGSTLKYLQLNSARPDFLLFDVHFQANCFLVIGTQKNKYS